MTEPETTPAVAPETEDAEDVQGHNKMHASEEPQSPDNTDQDTEGHVIRKF
jgi:hypothetical protein